MLSGATPRSTPAWKSTPASPPPMQRVLAVRTQVRTSAPARSFLSVIAPANQSACACWPRVNIGETETVLPAGRLAETRRMTPAGSGGGVGAGVGAGVEG